ncbi:transcription factor [Schizosaccharomyces octosporus yFS286]|uniref:Transcription factor n=1 Tax=Schizosaccharomyces octosporus (strain yFS286) TaxID=483514 RepID=S9QZP0_SCHOY|nr:transcription factor [Schizosaccharomyces octosporus yFS286]EPX71720.1 transcription factor [Schizosaccharomyces octosporus yFS286]
MTEYMDMESSSTSNSKPQNFAKTAADSLHPKESLDYYIYDYFVKHRFQETAKAFYKESKVQVRSNDEQNTNEVSTGNNEDNNPQKDASQYDQTLFDTTNGKSEHLDSFDMNIQSKPNPALESQKDVSSENKNSSVSLPTPSVAIDIPEGFLVEWFNIFWDVFSARVSRVNSSAHLYDSQFNRSVYRGQGYSTSASVPPNGPHMHSSVANPLNYTSAESKSSENKPQLPFGSAVPKSDPITGGNNKPYVLPSRAVPLSGPSNMSHPDKSQKYGSLLPAGTVPNPAVPYSLGTPSSSIPPGYPNPSVLASSPPGSYDSNSHVYSVGPGMNANSSRNAFYPPTPAQIHQLKSRQEFLQRQSKQMSEPAVNLNQAAFKDPPQMQSSEQSAMNSASGMGKKRISDPKALYNANIAVNPTARNSASPIITQASSGMGGGSSPFYPYQNSTRETASVPAIKPSPNIMIQPRYPTNSEALVNDMQKYRAQNNADGIPPHMPQNAIDLNSKYGTNPIVGNRPPSQHPYLPSYYRGQPSMSSPHPQMYEANAASQGSMEYAKARELAMRRGQTPNMSTLPKDSVSGEANNVDLGNPLTDYHMQLMILEEQNKKRLLMARQEGEREFLSPQTHEHFDHEIKNSQLKLAAEGPSPLHSKPSEGMTTQIKGSDVSTAGLLPPHQKQPSLPSQHPYMNVPPNEQPNIMMSQFLNRTKQPEAPLDAQDFRDPNMTKKFSTNTPLMTEQDKMSLDNAENSNSWHVQNSDNNLLDAKEKSDHQPQYPHSSQPELRSSTTASGNPNPDSQAYMETARDNLNFQKDPMRASDTTVSNGYPSMSDSVQRASMTSEGTQQNGAASSEAEMNAHKEFQNSERKEEDMPEKGNTGEDDKNGNKDGLFNGSTDNTFNYASKNDSNAELLNDFDFESFLNDAGDDSTQAFY